MADNDLITERTIAFSTPWFRVAAKRVRGEPEPFYNLETVDYSAIVATTVSGDFVLVRQFRPAVERYTLELPSGHVDPGVSADETARCELREETGYETGDLRFLGAINTDVGRMGNRMWCYWARDVRPPGSAWQAEAGITVEICSPGMLRGYVADGTFNHALHLAVLALATFCADPLIVR